MNPSRERSRARRRRQTVRQTTMQAAGSTVRTQSGAIITPGHQLAADESLRAAGRVGCDVCGADGPTVLAFFECDTEPQRRIGA